MHILRKIVWFVIRETNAKMGENKKMERSYISIVYSQQFLHMAFCFLGVCVSHIFNVRTTSRLVDTNLLTL